MNKYDRVNNASVFKQFFFQHKNYHYDEMIIMILRHQHMKNIVLQAKLSEILKLLVVFYNLHRSSIVCNKERSRKAEA